MLTSKINADSNLLQKISSCAMSIYYFQSVQVIQHQYASMDQDVWTCHTSNNVLVGWATVKRTRFELLTKYLRFSLCSTRPSRRQQTKFAAMGSEFDMWEQRLSRPFIPYECVTVDETSVSFRAWALQLQAIYAFQTSQIWDKVLVPVWC